MDLQTNPFLARFDNVPALIAPDRRGEFESALVALAADPRLSDAMAAATTNDDTFWTELGRSSSTFRPYVVSNGVLTIPIRGILLNDFPYQFFGYATGYPYIRKAFQRGLADPDVKGIAFIINSPGGEVAGNFDLVDTLYAGRGKKPVRAFAAEAAYSAAYSIASAADTISLPRTGGVGSIGIVGMHIDVSAALEDSGIKVTLIYAGKHKIDTYPYAPLSDAAKARMQADVDSLYEVFVSTVARNRKLDAQAVRDTEALTFRAPEAVSNKLADSIGSLDAALAAFAADVSNPDEGDQTMSDTKAAMTVASAKADYPDVANARIAEGKDAATAENKTAIDQAVAADRVRIAGLDKLEGKVGGNEAALKIIADAKADGSSVEATGSKLIEIDAFAKAGVVQALRTDDASASGARPAVAADPNAKPVAQTPDGWKAEWEASAELQGKFDTAGAYVGFKKYEQRRKGGK